jgi:hypothetical protein
VSISVTLTVAASVWAPGAYFRALRKPAKGSRPIALKIVMRGADKEDQAVT